jgi:hypothetical protein
MVDQDKVRERLIQDGWELDLLPMIWYRGPQDNPLYDERLETGRYNDRLPTNRRRSRLRCKARRRARKRGEVV